MVLRTPMYLSLPEVGQTWNIKTTCRKRNFDNLFLNSSDLSSNAQVDMMGTYRVQLFKT